MKKQDEAVHFEALKAGYAQTKGGHSLRFTVAVNDLPKAIAEADIGTRYLVALVEMPDTIEDYNAYAGKRAVQLAGILCKDHHFQLWVGDNIDKTIFDNYEVGGSLEIPVSEALRKYLRVVSRSDLANNTRAMDLFYEIKDRFDAWKLANP